MGNFSLQFSLQSSLQLCAIMAAVAALAGPVQAETVKSYRLYTEVSQPGETMDQFVVRIAPKALSITRRLGAEVCGNIEKTESGYSITVRTSREHTWCAVPISDGVQTFHTHPAKTKQIFSEADHEAPGYLASGAGVFHQAGKNTARTLQ